MCPVPHPGIILPSLPPRTRSHWLWIALRTVRMRGSFISNLPIPGLAIFPLNFARKVNSTLPRPCLPPSLSSSLSLPRSCAFAMGSLRKSNYIFNILSRALSQIIKFIRYVFISPVITGKSAVNYFSHNRLLLLPSSVISLFFCLLLSTRPVPKVMPHVSGFSPEFCC